MNRQSYISGKPKPLVGFEVDMTIGSYWKLKDNAPAAPKKLLKELKIASWPEKVQIKRRNYEHASGMIFWIDVVWHNDPKGKSLIIYPKDFFKYYEPI